MQRLTYVIGLIFSVLSQLVFFFLIHYHTDPTGRSWILFHPDHWRWALVLNVISILFIIVGIIAEVRGVNKTEIAETPQKSARARTWEPHPASAHQHRNDKKLDDIEKVTEKKRPICEFWKTGGCSLRYTGKSECGRDDEILCPYEHPGRSPGEVVGAALEPVGAPKVWKEEEFE